MRTHERNSCIELWNIIEHGLFIGDPTNLTRREIVNSQLNATALHMIQQGLGTKDYPHIEHFSIAKEAWDALTVLFVGNESMRRNRYDALSNEAEDFYMKEGEDHEDMYRRLKTTATAFRNVGASHVDDPWIKRKYMSALMPFELTDLKSLQGRHNYHLMTSNEVMQDMATFKVTAKNAKDARARALGMSYVGNVALKAKVLDHGDEDDSDEGLSMDHPDEVKISHGQYMAFYAKKFWKNPAKAKMEMQRRSNPNGRRENVTKLRTCFNCGERYHFVAGCPYEKREDHGGKLVLKKTPKEPYKKPFIKKNPINKKSGEIVLITHEEYSSDNEDDEEEEEETSHGVAALATTSTPKFSLFILQMRIPPSRMSLALWQEE